MPLAMKRAAPPKLEEEESYEDVQCEQQFGVQDAAWQEGDKAEDGEWEEEEDPNQDWWTWPKEETEGWDGWCKHETWDDGWHGKEEEWNGKVEGWNGKVEGWNGKVAWNGKVEWNHQKHFHGKGSSGSGYYVKGGFVDGSGVFHKLPVLCHNQEFLCPLLYRINLSPCVLTYEETPCKPCRIQPLQLTYWAFMCIYIIPIKTQFLKLKILAPSILNTSLPI